MVFIGIKYAVFLIVGGLYLVTAWRENDQERVTVYTKHRLKYTHRLHANDGGLKN